MSKSIETINTIDATIAKLRAERDRIVKAERDMESRFESKLQVKHVDGKHVGFADTFVEAEALMRADAEKRMAEIVAECKRKHCKIVGAIVPTSDYVVIECKVWRDKEA